MGFLRRVGKRYILIQDGRLYSLVQDNTHILDIRVVNADVDVGKMNCKDMHSPEISHDKVVG